MSAFELLGKTAMIICLGAGLATVHSSFKPKFPIILKGDNVGAEGSAIATHLRGSEREAGTSAHDARPALPAGTTTLPPRADAMPVSPTAPAPALKDFEIDVPTAFAYFQQGKTFIDSRHLPDFEAGHVKNAFQLSADELLAGKAGDWFMTLDKSDVVVIYCGGGDCDASHNLRNYMVASFQFQNCLIMHDGWPGWTNAGHPGEQGPPQFGNNP